MRLSSVLFRPCDGKPTLFHKLAFELSGPITLPDPLAPPNPLTVFNYYAQTKHHGNVLQQNIVEGIRFGEGSGVTLTAIGSEM